MAPGDDREGFAHPPAFSIEAGPAPADAMLLVLVGEVDLATSGEFRRHVERALDGPASTVVLDLSEVTFVDSTMLRELLRAQSELRDRDRRLVLAGAQPAVLRLLELTGTLEVFEIAPDRQAAWGNAS